MSTELTVVLSVLGIAGLIGLFYVSHSIEKQRRQRALLIANISDYAFRLQALLDTIPPAYTGKDIQLLLLGEIRKRMERLKELAPSNDKFRKKLDSTLEQMAEISAATTKHTKPQLKNPEEANQLRIQLQQLSKIIENLTQNKVLAVADARRHLAFIQASFIEANLNFLIQLAESARQEGKPKVAILNYEKAIAEMKKRNQKGAYNERIEQIRATINALKVEAGGVVQTDETAPNELDQAMNELLEEEDAWKKKYF